MRKPQRMVVYRCENCRVRWEGVFETTRGSVQSEVSEAKCPKCGLITYAWWEKSYPKGTLRAILSKGRPDESSVWSVDGDYAGVGGV